MDELIRDFESLEAAARRDREQQPVDGILWALAEGKVLAYAYATKKAREAKRRMAEREPSWDLQP